MLFLSDDKIELAQARKGLSQTDLAKLSGLSSLTINSVKKGHPCKPETLHKLAKALDVDPSELLQESNPLLDF